MSSLLDKLTGKSHSSDNSNSSSSHSSSSSSSHSSSSMSSSSSSSMGSTTSGPYVSGAAGATNAGLTGTKTTNTTTTQSQYQTGNQGVAYNNQGMTDDAMTRSEERLRVGKETVGAGSARLDKYVTTEHVQTSVPVTKERVVIEREPITDANVDKATAGPAISEAHHEVTLTEERALAQKEVVPIERIRLGKQVESHEQQVGADLRKEHVDLTTTGINEKFDNVGYGKTTGTTMNTTNETAAQSNMMGKNTTGSSV